METINLNCNYIGRKQISIAVGGFSLLHMIYGTIFKCLWCLWEVLFIIGHLRKALYILEMNKLTLNKLLCRIVSFLNTFDKGVFRISSNI